VNIPKSEIIGRPKKIGTLGSEPVMELQTIGGLALVFLAKNGTTQILGVGSHKAIARHIALKENPDIQLTELSKSEDLPPWLIEQLAKSEGAAELTAAVRQVELELSGEFDV
jgi:hypothetical protein